MRRWLGAVVAIFGAGLAAAFLPAIAAAAPPCDEYNPAGPWRSAHVTLNPSDFVDDSRDEMRTFILTESIGAVEASLVAARPLGTVRAVSAVPQLSRMSPYVGEQLKGIAVTVLLSGPARPISVTVSLRQICAQHFRNTFLYY